MTEQRGDVEDEKIHLDGQPLRIKRPRAYCGSRATTITTYPNRVTCDNCNAAYAADLAARKSSR